MSQTTRKFVTAAAIGAIALLLWWWAGRRGEESAGPAEAAGASGGPAIDVGPLVDEARLARLDPRLAERAAISGRVHEADGRGIAGATVCAGSSAPGLGSAERAARTCTTSAADGFYRIEGLLPVPQFVHASAPGHVPGQHRAGPGRRARTLVTLRAGQVTTGIDVVLASGGVELKGVVRDLSGGELEGALVSSGFAYARSGADGTFTLWVAPGETYLDARADGYAKGWMMGVAPGMTFEIALTPESVLVGRVVRAEDGAPVAGASVYAEKHLESSSQAVTDANGNFRIEGLKPGAYRLEAFHDEAYGTGPESAVLGLGETSEPIVIKAHPAFLVEGTVTIAGGGSCEQGWVRLSDKAVGTRGGQVDADGLVRIRGVLPGTYEPQVECDTYVAEASYEPVAVVDAPIRGLRWQVQPGQAIRGRVVLSGGTAARGLHVGAEPQVDPSTPRARTTRAWSEPTADDGRFELLGLLPGRYRVSASSGEQPRLDPPVDVELPEGQDLEDILVTLPATGELRGTVKDSEGLPVQGVEVTLRGGQEWLPTTRTLDDGSFRLPHVPAGEYRVQAVSAWTPLQAPGTTDDDVQGKAVTIATGEVREVQLVVESQHGRIVGRVVDSAGGPLSDAFVEATRESDSAAAGAGDALRDSRWTFGGAETRKLTDQDGRFELTRLGDGNYTLVAQRRGGGEGSVEHVKTGSEVEIRIADAGSISGTVRIQGGGTPQEFEVTLNDPSTGWRSGDKFFRTGGVFRFPEVPRGNYSVIVEAAEGAVSTKTSVSEGGRAEVQVELLPLLTVRGRVVDALSGEPVPGMEVRIRARGQVQMFTLYDQTPKGQTSDEQGRFEVEKVAAGAAQAVVLPKDWVDNGYGWSTIALDVPSTGATAVELPPLKIAKKRRNENEAPGDLGLRVRPPAPETEPGEAKLIVAAVRPGGPAMRAGLQVGDEIVSIDGQDVTGANGYLFHDLSAVPAGTTLKVGLGRGATIEVVADAMK
ncbi:Carboxypeptidase regulatory-like domain-containing protein [Nannocystis exedens]|uniref:Carboxypeptidase regulatory-like domain-containing protein n=1 Tax=Nannocystis exedens TaxID=54 RepID=A0A1I2CUS4_9BACT|nr:carboxypeptidase regulatory-like domain-containing protein [Nannocystis exedens]PCC68589.1 Cna protein B-type domain protein [Nannocystis exedens]SFE71935.1 Carboxypeptidase regulatory-like domain-containing protein [Nannocystis exedens]